MNEERIIIQKLCSRFGKDVNVYAPSNAQKVLKELKENNLYRILHRHGKGIKETILEFRGTTLFNKSCVFKDLSRPKVTEDFIEMVIPTQNILDITNAWI
jgi:hypothetical protein